MAAMNTSTPRSRVARSRATTRLRNLTVGTTIAGFAASAGFGALAAMTFDGNGTTIAPITTTTPESGTSSTPALVAEPPASLSPTPVSEGSSSSSSGSSSSGVSRSTGRAHVTTGGS